MSRRREYPPALAAITYDVRSLTEAWGAFAAEAERPHVVACIWAVDVEELSWEVDERDVLAAHADAASLLARVAALAWPLVLAGADAHGCAPRHGYPDGRLYDREGSWCELSLVHRADGGSFLTGGVVADIGSPPGLELSVPAESWSTWAERLNTWLAALTAMDAR